MPSRIDAPLPALVEVAARTVRLDLFLGVLHALSAEPEQSLAELADRLDVSQISMRRALAQLETDLVVVSNEPRGRRTGRRVTYRVSEARVRELLGALEDYLLDR